MIEYERDFDHKIAESDTIKMMNTFGSLVREYEKGVSGYYNLPENSNILLQDVKSYMEHNKELLDSTNTIALVGIGGSSLGIKAIDSLLKHKYSSLKTLLFFENPDPIAITENLKKIDPKRTIFIIVSKSGGTIETTSIFKLMIEHFGLELTNNKRIIAITDEGSPLCNFSDYHSLKTFVIPKNVGGRFSVLSSVGVIPLTLAGYNVENILDGAKKFLDRFFASEEEHLLIKANFLTKFSKIYTQSVLFSYSDTLEDFTKWFVQLWGESLGKIDKSGKSVGLTPIGHIGSIDQHSFLQLIMEGPKDKFVTFIKVDDFENDLKIPDISLKNIEKTDYINTHSFNELINAECDATKESLQANEIPLDAIILDKISEKNIGELIVYFELLTSACGVMLDIDTYNQPGVEYGKKILQKKFKKD